MRSTAQDEAGISRTQRIGLACACTIAFAFSANYTNHSPMVQTLAAEFHFSLAAAGLLTTGIFLTHAAMQIPGGHLADRFGPKPVLSLALAIVCVGSFAIGFAASYEQLLFWKMFTGIGTGASFVAGARYVSTMFAGPRLHLAQGFYGGSILLGSGFVIFAVPALLARTGWRGAFFSTSILAAIALMLWLVVPPPPVAGVHHAAPIGGMLSNPQLWLLGIVQMASFGLVIVVGAWVTTYLRTAAGVSLKEAGRIGSLVLLLGIVTRPLGGVLVPRIGVHPVLRISLLLNAAGCLLLAMGNNSLLPGAAAIVLLGAGCGLPYAAVFNRAGALYPARAGAAMGLVNMLGIVMILAAPPLVGQLVEWSGSFRSSFLFLGGFTLLALAATFGISRDEPHRSV